jgi:hypothetical protein
MSLTDEDAQRIAHGIAFGHAYWKHVADAAEYGSPIRQSTFEQIILETLHSPTKNRMLRLNRTVFWNGREGLWVIHNPADPDLGTAYWPAEGRHEYENLR